MLALAIYNFWPALSRNPDGKKIFENHLVDQVKQLFPQTSDIHRNICTNLQSQYGAIICKLVYLRGTPTLRPKNSVIIWNLLWLSGRLIICTEQTRIYISTVLNTVYF